MVNNPELRRQLWLELTPNRMMMMPLTLGAIFFLFYLTADNMNEFMGSLRTVSLLAFGIIILIWGTKLVSESVISEVNEKTWDSQRMTPISPSDMTIGKLFGSTVYTWYGAAICSAAALIAIIYLRDAKTFKIFLILLISGLLIHSFSLLSSLVMIRRNIGREKVNSNGLFVFSVILTLWLMGIIPSMIFGYRGKDSLIIWYDIRFFPEDFSIVALIFFLTWSCIGAYRNMKTEFQMSNGPFVWMIFLISIMLFFSGLIANIKSAEAFARILLSCYLSYIIAITATYIMAFSEPKSIVEFRRIISLMKQGQWKEFGEAIPLWLISLGFCVILCAILLMLSPFDSMIDKAIKSEHLSVLHPLNCLLFVLRDLSLLIYVNLKGESQRADIAAAVYLILIYGLIPAIVGVSGFKNLLPIFLPMFNATIINGTIPILIQSAVMIWLMYHRWELKSLR